MKLEKWQGVVGQLVIDNDKAIIASDDEMKDVASLKGQVAENGKPVEEMRHKLLRDTMRKQANVNVLEFEKGNGFFKNIGNGLFTDEMVMLGVNSKHAVNASLFTDKATDRTQAELRSFVDNTKDLQTKHNLEQQRNAPSI